MDIYRGITTDEVELPDEISKVCASLLNQYIEEDGIMKDDPEDRRVEKLMRFSELYFVRFLKVSKIQEAGGREAVVKWQSDLNESFFEHSRLYHDLYSQVKHMAEAPYFMTNWSICYLVSTALEAQGVDSEEAYKNLSESERSELEYVLRFGENLLQKFRTEVM